MIYLDVFKFSSFFSIEFYSNENKSLSYYNFSHGFGQWKLACAIFLIIRVSSYLKNDEKIYIWDLLPIFDGVQWVVL